MSLLYPNFTEKLQSMGAVRLRGGKDIAIFLPDGNAYTFTGSVREPRDLGFDIYSQSHPLLEHCVRQCTLAFRNVRFQSGSSVQELLWKNKRVEGVRFTHDGNTNSLSAELTIDAGGRGSRVPRWLAELGFQVPVETMIGVDFAYSSAKYRIPGYWRAGALLGFFRATSTFSKWCGYRANRERHVASELRGPFRGVPAYR